MAMCRQLELIKVTLARSGILFTMIVVVPTK